MARRQDATHPPSIRGFIQVMQYVGQERRPAAESTSLLWDLPL